MGSSIDRDSVRYDIERFTGMVVDSAKDMKLKSQEMCSLDCVFFESLLPNLWTNVDSKMVLEATCKPKRNSKNKECTGPASIVVEFTERRLNESINTKMEFNRQQRDDVFNLSIQNPPLQLCEAAMHLEALVK